MHRDLHSHRRARLTGLAPRLVALGVLLSVAAVAQAQERSEFADLKAVSYLVFHRSAGFERPTVTLDPVLATLTLRFKRLPAQWASLLELQLGNETKHRFFSGFEPLVEAGKTVGIVARLGVGTFSVQIYTKQAPVRWVLRVGERRTPPPDLEAGPLSVPVVPYADLIDDEAEGRAQLMGAERDLSTGKIDSGCGALEPLAVAFLARPARPAASGAAQALAKALPASHETPDEAARREVETWATLRSADCLARNGNAAEALARLERVAQDGRVPGATVLARLRSDAVSGNALGAGFDAALYRQVADNELHGGSVSDEARYRLARVHLLRSEAHAAVAALESLARARPESPFLHGSTLLNVLRWRAVRDGGHSGRWDLAATTFADIPAEVSPLTPYWLDTQQLGALAFRHVGLPRRAVPVYMTLLACAGETVDVKRCPRLGKAAADANRPRADELAVLEALTETYLEAEDGYRARQTLDWLDEKRPELRTAPAHLRLRERAERLRGNAKGSNAAVSTLAASGAGQVDVESATTLTAAAARALETEGLTSARALLDVAGGAVATAVMRADLAFAAGDCAALARAAEPLALAPGETLLYSGACLLREGRAVEAAVYFEAARVYAAADVDPTLENIVRLAHESATWRAGTGRRLQLLAGMEAPKS